MYPSQTPSSFRASVFFAVLVLVALGLAAQDRPTVRVTKLALEPDRLSAAAGEEMEIEIQLTSAAGQPAGAWKDLQVDLGLFLASGKEMQRTVPFATGQTTRRLRLTIPEPGLVEIRVTQPELLEASRLFQVKPAATAPGDLESKISVELLSEEEPENEGMESEIVMERFGRSETAALPEQIQTQDVAETEAESPHNMVPVGAEKLHSRPQSLNEIALQSQDFREFRTPLPPPVEAADEVAALPTLWLDYRPQRSLLANGVDPASIYAILRGSSLENEVEIQLFNSDGEMIPGPPLKIPPGETLAETKLTAQAPATVKVSFISSNPPLEIEGQDELEIDFEYAVTHFTLEASPNRISLAESAELLSRLQGEGGETPTSRLRQVSLGIDRGHGYLADSALRIAESESNNRTRFYPSWPGRAVIWATIPNMRRQKVEVEVEVPWVLLCLTVFGGLAGGLLRHLRHRKEGGQLAAELVTGVITGFVLYWALLFGIVDVEGLHRPILINPLSAIASTVMGGWMGTEVLSWLLKKWGLLTAAT